MEMPDVTLVQKLVAAVVAAVVAIGSLAGIALAAFGIASPAEAGAVAGAIAGSVGALGAVYVAADAVIRNGRSRALQNPESVRELERPGPAAFND